MEPTGHWACLSAGRKGSPAAGRTTARSKASVARALMATAQAFDVDRRSLPLLLGRCFLAVASCPKRDATPWGIDSAGPGRVESGLTHRDLPMKTKTPAAPHSLAWRGRQFSGLATLCAASRGSATPPALRCARLQISRLSAVEPAGRAR